MTANEQATAVVRAFLIADIRGYSRFSREHGDAAAAALAQRFADLAREAVEARGGTVVELRGDEVLAAFPHAAHAVQAAVELQLICAEESERDPALLVGVGVDIGPAVPVEDGYRGIAINLAARLCSSAGANEVLVTEAVAEQSAAVADEVVFSPRGTATFKGFEEPVSVVEVQSRWSPKPLSDGAPNAALPPELIDAMPIVGRTSEQRWLRGTWRQVRRGRGRVLVGSGPAGIGKTRLAAALAAHVLADGGAVRYAGPGGLAAADAQAAVAAARTARTASLVVIDHADILGDEAVAAVADAAQTIADRPVLLLVLVRDPASSPALSGLVERCAAQAGHRRLPALSGGEVAELVAIYAGEAAAETPVEMIARASRGVPASVHEHASEWARAESARRLEAAAGFMAAARERRSSDLEFANNVIGLKLGRLFAAAGAAPPAEIEELGPYKGLASFDASDAAWFFGREQIVGELAARLVGSGALAVLGASGSGKSSVVAAGLLPSLRAGLLPGSGRWTQAGLRPGSRPMAALRAALASNADDPAAAAIAQLDDDSRLVLSVDQFEEVFTACESEAERSEFLHLLATHAIQRSDAFAVVATMRSDFYGHLAAYPALARLFADNHVLVRPLTRAELQRVVELPAQRAGVRIESGLIDALVDEAAGEPGALPLLSTALVELWQARSGGWIRAAAYHEGGGIRGAVARLAESSYAQLDEADQRAAKRVLLRLASASDGDATTRRRVELDEFDLSRDVSARRVIDRFTTDRLLTISGSTVEVAHEALLREWPRLRSWLDEDVHGRQLRQHLTLAARGWDASGRERSEVYRGARLSTALEWAGEHPADLNDLERAFLAASREASEQEADKARRTNRRLRALLAGALVLLLVAVGAVVVALVQRSSAQRASTAALADSLGAQAVSQPRLDRAMLLARESVALHSSDHTRSELLSTVLRAPSILRTYHENLNRLNNIALSPDGKVLVLADNDDHVVVEDAATGRVLRRLLTSANFVAFAPDGELLRLPPDAKVFTGLQRVDARTGAVLGMWRFARSVLRTATVARQTTPGVPPGVTNPAYELAPDGRTAVVSMFAPNPAAPDNFVFQLAYPSGQVVGPVIKVASTGDFPPVAYVDGGRAILTRDPTHILVFDARTGHRLHAYPASTQPGPDAVSHDGRTYVYSAADGSLRFLDVRTGRTSSSVGVVPGGANVMTFALHDSMLIAGGSQGAVQLWNARSHHLIESLPGHAANVIGTVVSADSRTLYTGSFDNIAAAWDLTGRRGSVPAFTAMATDPAAGTFSLGVSPDGRTIAVGSTTGQVGLFRTGDYARVAMLPAGKGIVTAVDWSADGRNLVVANSAVTPAHQPAGSSLRLFDVDDPRRPRFVRQLASPFSGINWASFTHDGRAVVFCGSLPGAPAFGGSGAVAETRVSDGHVVARPTLTPKGFTVFVAAAPTADRVVAVGYGGFFAIIDPTHRRVIAQSGGGGELTDAAAYSPDGSTIAVADFVGQLTLVDAQTGRVRRKVQLIAEPLAAVVYSPDGRMIATVDTSENTRLYDATTLRQIGATFAPSWEQQSVVTRGLDFSFARFAPDGRHLFLSDEWGRVWVLPTSQALWTADACRIANRSFTRAEWSQYVTGRSYQPGCPAG